MENQNQNPVSSYGPDTRMPASGDPVLGSIPEDMLQDSNALSLEPTVSGLYDVAKTQTAHSKWSFLRFAKRIDVALGIVTVIGVACILLISSHMNKQQTSSSSSADLITNRYNTIQIPLSPIVTAQSSSAQSASNTSLTVNGSIQLNGNLALTPSLQPTGAKAGQIYYDSSNNQLAYYNGQNFVFLTPAGPTGIQSLNGATGQLALGTGLSLSGTTLLNSGVLSIQGKSGAVSLTAGPGIVLNGTTISVTGVGTVTSSGGTNGSIPVYTTSQNIENSIITQNGSTINVGGSLTINNALTVSNGGTGATSLANDGVIVGQGTSALASVATPTPGLCLISTAGLPTWGVCSGGGGVASLDGLSGALTLANSSGASSTVTINSATTSTLGIASFNATNFSVAGGAVNTIQDIDSSATPTFAGVDTNNINPSGTLTVGATTQSLVLQGSASSTLTATSGGSSTILGFTTPTANVTYDLQTAAAGTYNVCTSAGNCVGVGGSVSTSGGAANALVKFNGSQTITNSSITDNGTTVTTTANLVIQGGTGTIGVANSQTGSLKLADGGSAFLGTIIQGSLTGNRTYTLPDATGVICTNSGNCLGGGGGGANTSLSNLTGVAINTTLLPGSTSIDIGSNVAPFRNLYLGGTTANNFEFTGVASAARTITIPDASGTLAISASGNIALSGVGNITFTGQLPVANGGTNSNTAGGARTSLGAAASGSNSDITNLNALTAITPTSTLTVGSSNQTFILQGSTSSIITATSGSDTTTLAFITPTANVTYDLQTAAAGTYNICTSVGNCLGGGGGGANTSLSNLTGVAINTTLLPGSTTIDLGSNSAPFQNLYLGGSATNNFEFTGSASAARTITIPDATGTLCLQGSASCAFAPGTAANYIQNQNVGAQSSANFWISGSGIAGTSLQAPLLDTATNTANSGSSASLSVASGSETGTSGTSGTLLLQSGSVTNTSSTSGGVTLSSGSATAASSSSGGVTITTGATTVSGNTGTVSISTGAPTSGNSGTISIASGSSVSGASGNVNINVGTATTTDGAINIGTTNPATSITIGPSGSTTIGSSINLANSTGAIQTIDIGGFGSSGGSNAGSTVTLQGGATDLIVANSGTTLQTFTNSTTALQVENTSNAALFTVDTTDSRVSLPNNALLTFDANHNAQIKFASVGNVLQIGNYNSNAPVQIQADNFEFQDTAGFNNDLSISNTGATVFENRTNSTTAFQIQNAGDANTLFNVDTTNDAVDVGVSGAPNLSGANLYAGDADFSGEVLVGTSSNNETFNGSTYEPTLSGTARHTETILLNAEYAGAVLDPGSGSNNVGTMTSDIDLSNRENYYQWTTVQSSSQSYDVDIQIPIPSNFSAWTSSTPLSVDDWASNTSNSEVELEVRDCNGNVETNDNFANISPASINTWYTNTAGSFSGTYAGGEFMTLRLRLFANSSANVRLGNIKLTYLAKY